MNLLRLVASREIMCLPLPQCHASIEVRAWSHRLMYHYCRLPFVHFLSGLRLFWCTSKFVLDSALIAVKLFQPAAELSENMQLSDVLLVWVEEVLREFGLSPSDVFSTVTDAGSDVKRLCLKVLASEWEWCFPHMLNCALVEVTEQSLRTIDDGFGIPEC